jgi:uncharacterized membrane protein
MRGGSNDNFLIHLNPRISILVSSKKSEERMITLEYTHQGDIWPMVVLHFRTRKIAFCFCHRQKDRCVPFFGLEKLFCARCLGILLGIISGACCRIFFQSVSLVFVAIMIAPLVIDGLTQAEGFRTSSNPLRLMSGVMFGFGTAMLIFY